MERNLVSEKIQFHELCNVFDLIRAASKDAKVEIFKKFVKRWHQELKRMNSDGSYEFRNDDTFYDALRLFVPSKDETRKFALKEAKLSKLVCDTLMTQSMEQGTLAIDVLVEKLVRKVNESLTTQSPSLSIKQVNSMLDRMKYPTEKRHQEKVLSELFRTCTSKELRWVFFILLDSMEKALGSVSSLTILRWFHKDAIEAFMNGDNLQQICDNFVGEESGENIIYANGGLLCKPFRPMLLKRLNFDKYCLPKIIKFCGRPFYLELKYDGEHLLVHRFNFTQYKYFTRNGNDYTHKMGPDCGSMISSRIHPFLLPNTREFVLDCELILWDKNLQSFVGKNKKSSDGKAYDVKHINDDFIKSHSHLQRSLAVFDILYLDGRSLVDEPLVERLKMLRKLFKDEDDSVIFISKKKTVQTAKEFADFYRHAMQNGDEGVVAKALNSIYRPGSRAEKNGWFKIKPDYGVQSVLDLAVVGIRYENGSLDHIKSFLVAARIPGSEETNLRFKIVAGVSARLKKLDYERLLELLVGDERLIEEFPEWLEKSNGTLGRNNRYVPKANIQVVEVRASGLIDGVLQFPSIVSIRNDKPVDETDTIDDVSQFDQRLRDRPLIDENDPHEAAILLNRKRKQNLKLKKTHQLVKDDGTLEGTISDKLRGKKVCVLNASSGVTCQELQKILISLGATPIANPGKDASFLVAMDRNKISCVSAIKADNYNIVHGNWLRKCSEKGTLVPWQQSDMIHISSKAPFDLFSFGTIEKEQQTIEQQNDNGGTEEEEKEEHMEEDNEEEMEEEENEKQEEEKEEEEESDEMVRIADVALSREKKICDEVKGLMSEVDCAQATRGNLFTGFVFYIHESVEEIGGAKNTNQLRDRIESQCGQISDVLDATVTHVVIDMMNPDQGDRLFAWNEQQKEWLGEFVTADWVEQSIASEDRYRVDERLHNWIRR